MEKISFGTHWPHPLWVITPNRISGLTPDLAEGRRWKENSSPSLYLLFCLLQESKLWGDFEAVLHYCSYQAMSSWHMELRSFLFTKPSQKSRWGKAGGSFTAWRAVGPSSKQAPVNVAPLWVYGALINKRDTTARHREFPLSWLLSLPWLLLRGRGRNRLLSDHIHGPYTWLKYCSALQSKLSDSAVLLHFLLIVVWLHYLSMEVITVHLLSLLPVSDHSPS